MAELSGELASEGRPTQTPSVGWWVMERCASKRFPFRLQIFKGDRRWLTLRVQDRWPTANRNIFCLREVDPPAPEEDLPEVERVPIVAWQLNGRRLSIVLDRPRLRRCDFLFLTKEYKGRPSEHFEQIYWVTQQSMQQRRPRARLVSTTAATEFAVRVAPDERYPWRFPGSRVERGAIPSGDYALMDGVHILAVIERKTFQNLLADFGTMDVLHQRLIDLASIKQHAFVVEAPYEDFLSPRKLGHYKATFCAAAIAQMYAAHPGVRIVFCANRKMANEWARNYFSAVWKARQSPAVFVAQDEPAYGAGRV